MASTACRSRQRRHHEAPRRVGVLGRAQDSRRSIRHPMSGPADRRPPLQLAVARRAVGDHHLVTSRRSTRCGMSRIDASRPPRAHSPRSPTVAVDRAAVHRAVLIRFLERGQRSGLVRSTQPHAHRRPTPTFEVTWSVPAIAHHRCTVRDEPSAFEGCCGTAGDPVHSRPQCRALFVPRSRARRAGRPLHRHYSGPPQHDRNRCCEVPTIAAPGFVGRYQTGSSGRDSMRWPAARRRRSAATGRCR